MSNQPITKRSITLGDTYYIVQSDGKIAYRTIIGMGWGEWLHVETVAPGGHFQGAVGLFLDDTNNLRALDRRANIWRIETDTATKRRYAALIEDAVPAPAPRRATSAGVPEGMYIGLVPNTAHTPCGRCGLDHPYWTKTFQGEGGAVCLPVLFTAAFPWHQPTVAPTHGMQVMIAGTSEFFPGVVWREDGVTDDDDNARRIWRDTHKIGERVPIGTTPVVRQDGKVVELPIDKIGEYQFDERGYLITESNRAPADEDPISGHELPPDEPEHNPWGRALPPPAWAVPIRTGDPERPVLTIDLNVPRSEIKTDQEFDPILRPVAASPMTAAADLCRQALPQLVRAIIELTNLPDGRGLDPSQVYTLLETAAISLHADAEREEYGEEPTPSFTRKEYPVDRRANTGIIPGRPGQGGRS